MKQDSFKRPKNPIDDILKERDKIYKSKKEAPRPYDFLWRQIKANTFPKFVFPDIDIHGPIGDPVLIYGNYTTTSGSSI